MSSTAIEHNGLVVYRHDPKSAVAIGSVDRAAFYQLKTMLQGVLARGTARSIGGPRAVRRRQDRHHRRRERRLVRRLHQRRHGGGLGRLRQRRRQAAHARRRRDRRPHRGPDLRADHAGGVGACRAQDRAGAAVARSEAPAVVQVDRPRIGRGAASAAAWRAADHRMLPHRSQGQIIDTQYRLVSRESAYIYRDPRGYDVAPNPFPFFAPSSSRSPAITTRAATMATTSDGYGRYIQAPRDSCDRPPRPISTAARSIRTAAVRTRSAGPGATAARIPMDASTDHRSARSGLYLGPPAILLKDIQRCAALARSPCSWAWRRWSRSFAAPSLDHAGRLHRSSGSRRSPRSPGSPSTSSSRRRSRSSTGRATN